MRSGPRECKRRKPSRCKQRMEESASTPLLQRGGAKTGAPSAAGAPLAAPLDHLLPDQQRKPLLPDQQRKPLLPDQQRKPLLQDQQRKRASANQNPVRLMVRTRA